MKAPGVRAAVAAVLIAAAALVLDLTVFGAALLHALLIGGLALSAFGTGWLLGQRNDLSLLATGLVAGSGLLYLAPWPFVAAAFGPVLQFLVTVRTRFLQLLGSMIIAGVLAAALNPFLPVMVLSVALAGALTLLRPATPTHGQLQALRGLALFLPAAALAAALALNAATGRADAIAPLTALRWSLGLVGVLALASLALLGLATLLESDEPRQAAAWGSVASAAGLVLASLVLKDPSRTLETLVVGVVPAVVLASVATVRFARAKTPGWRWALAIPALPCLLQFGLAT